MATVSFIFDQLFMLLVPELVIGITVAPELAVISPSEPNFVQNTLSIKSKFVCSMTSPLTTNPVP
jgi:hypothetical protein